MKLMIDIQDEIYNYLQNCNVYISGMRSGKSFVDKMLYAIANGKPIDNKYEERNKKDADD